MSNDSPHGALISSEDVEGTKVYSTTNREKIGDVDHVMIDKKSGRVAYAVMTFGGFLGLGQDHYPVPWAALEYDEDLGGYITGISEDQLKNAPNFDDQSWSNRDWETRIHHHYHLPIYWEGQGYI